MCYWGVLKRFFGFVRAVRWAVVLTRYDGLSRVSKGFPPTSLPTLHSLKTKGGVKTKEKTRERCRVMSMGPSRVQLSRALSFPSYLQVTS